jgi:putative addiction module component (TIGR02574 family)
VIAIEEVRQMSLHEKLQLMEAVWEDIARDEEALEVPEWHKTLLDERERLIREGKAQFIDWEEAKQRIREATR